MKKIILCLFLILLLTGCKKESIKENNTKEFEEEEKKEEVVSSYVDNNPIKVGLYQNNHLVSNYNSTIRSNQDLAVFEIYLTNDEEIKTGRQIDIWKYYYNQYQNIDNYKVGFNISFKTKEKEIDKTILSPSNMFSMSPYMYVYLYDDIIHSNDSWYSHLEEKDFNDNTIISSIKLYYTTEANSIISPIYLTVFTYDEDDFDEDNNYRGISKYTLEIKTN